MKSIAKEWFKTWFNTPYYHILYKNRNVEEAELFIDKIVNILAPGKKARMLDLACGKGRYSRHLANKGFDVTGVDLSINSIEYARQFETENLSFYTHDMRQPFWANYFDYVFNFFTSFGYFERERDDLRTLKNIRIGLKRDGTFVMDFFNSNYVEEHLTGIEVKEIDGITFDLHKWIEKGFVKKAIHIKDGEQEYFFEEKVRLLRLDDFERLFKAAGLEILQTFGDYHLNTFDRQDSPRLIIVSKIASK